MTAQCHCGGEMYEGRDVLTVRLTSKGKPHIVRFANLACWRCKECGAIAWDSKALAERIEDFRTYFAARARMAAESGYEEAAHGRA